MATLMKPIVISISAALAAVTATAAYAAPDDTAPHDAGPPDGADAAPSPQAPPEEAAAPADGTPNPEDAAPTAAPAASPEKEKKPIKDEDLSKLCAEEKKSGKEPSDRCKAAELEIVFQGALVTRSEQATPVAQA